MAMCRARLSRDNYADLDNVCRNLHQNYIKNDEAKDILNKLMKRINTKRRKKGLDNIPTPSIKFYGTMFTNGGVYKFNKHQIRIPNDSSIYMLIHELAHALHYTDALSFAIKTYEMDGRFDWHGVRFVRYLIVLRDIIEKQKYFQKYLG